MSVAANIVVDVKKKITPPSRSRQHANRFANRKFAGKIAHAFEQSGSDFLAARNQEQAFAGLEVFADTMQTLTSRIASSSSRLVS